jgi:hypothetical protein
MNESDSSKWTARWPDEWHGASDPALRWMEVGW